MDKLSRFIKRDDNGHGPGGNGASPQPAEPPAKEGGHGDHWGCIFRAVEQDAIISLIQDVVAEDTRPAGFQAPGGGAAYRSKSASVRVVVLVVGDTLESAYPESQLGTEWPIVINEIVPWSNGIEAQISGECHGASISFFDTRYYENRHKYKVGREYNFLMSAFAYIVGLAPDAEVEIEAGTKVSLKGARAYMPANIGSNPDAEIDEFWFHSPIESATSETEIGGRRLHAFPITMALPNDFEMSLTLYAADHNIDTGLGNLDPERLRGGEEVDLEGYLWLQGYLSDLSEV